ncbi:MAG: DNA translocase FtsK [Planctomycetota bacterium]|nr:DNA translocase FtsK [Planctomycetota bacterium]
MKTEKITRFCFAFLLWAGVLFCAVALVSFSPSDIPFLTSTAKGSAVSNLCGEVGAYISYHMLMQLGLASWGLLAILSAFGWLLMRGEHLNGIWPRLYASLFFIVSLACLLSLLDNIVFSPSKLNVPVSFGGIVGQAFARWLTAHLHALGTIILLGVVFLVSISVASNMWVNETTMAIVKRIFPKKGSKTAKPDKKKAEKKRPEPDRKEREGAGFGGVLKDVLIPPREDEDEDEESDEPLKPSRKPPKPKEEEPDLPFAGVPEKKVPPPAPKPRRRKQSFDETGYQLPPLSLFKPPTQKQKDFTKTLEAQASAITSCLKDFGVEAEVVRYEVGPTVTLYELKLPPGVKISTVSSLSDNLAMSLKAQSLRIIAPIPGKSTIGIETPNPEGETVVFRDLADLDSFDPDKYMLPMLLGKKGAGEPLVADLAKMPHILIAGATGSGKSVCLNSIILSLLAFRSPREVKFILADPKMVELSLFQGIPHLITPVVTNMRKAPGVLDWAVNQMEERYKILSRAGVRDIKGYNELGAKKLDELFPDPEEREEFPDHLPYIVIVVDELADLMMISKKEIEWSVTRLAQKSRAIGVHIVLATQRPSVNVITGLIKANMPCRISFQVSSKVDSRTIIDQIGSDKLLGRGDMLFLPPSSSKLTRAQGVFVSDDEIKRIIDFIRDQGDPEYDELLEKAAEKSAEQHKGSSATGKPSGFSAGGVKGKKNISYVAAAEKKQSDGDAPADLDELFEDAVQVVLEEQRGSVSLLQRKLTVGYGRASRLIDQMEQIGVLGEYRGSKPREILITLDEWKKRKEEMLGGSGGE